mmetsp:Transcript_12256/g.29889  ORF Transcript_12256/g.29889 Transcript_12256/m.29889 type:complete len:86 (+) Transcript_12256:85-342(+)|eukprot:CAMPEP_0202859690 /NCGR_PEP_ID=MMETSP1391-20130828/1694_2 /ASSEMBLY_ACC=CAM_ASM_000867 /TAXON_ID=1034604 /ORGANISM="Chlamydomonas leiostraca, Strain SAG 11-49" /LENGTH=85 /DNA_ID=CAMNT_0049538745 /DNA_START=82 /DNA_END=339 /DNA_ORIENTATION=-
MPSLAQIVLNVLPGSSFVYMSQFTPHIDEVFARRKAHRTSQSGASSGSPGSQPSSPRRNKPSASSVDEEQAKVDAGCFRTSLTGR